MTILPSINIRPLSVLNLPEVVDIRFWERTFMRESPVDGVYELCIGIVTSARHPIVVASICCYLDDGCFYCSIYFVQEVDIFRGWVCGAQAYQSFYHGYWIAGDCIRPLCHLPGQCWMLKEYLRHFSFNLKRRGLFTLLRSLSPNTPLSC